MDFNNSWPIALAFILYLILMMGIGLYYSRQQKNLSSYILGDRKLGPWLTSMSAEASDMSGWMLMGLPGYAYLHGLSAFHHIHLIRICSSRQIIQYYFWYSIFPCIASRCIRCRFLYIPGRLLCCCIDRLHSGNNDVLYGYLRSACSNNCFRRSGSDDGYLIRRRPGFLFILPRIHKHVGTAYYAGILPGMGPWIFRPASYFSKIHGNRRCR